MSNEVKLLLQVSIILLQFYIGAIAFLYPDKLHMGHIMVVLLVSVPIIIGAVRKNKI